VETLLGRGDVMTEKRVDANSKLHTSNGDMIADADGGKVPKVDKSPFYQHI
jgi:hypothetical protein